MVSYGAGHQPVFRSFPVAKTVFPLPFSAIFHKIGEESVRQCFSAVIQIIDIIHIVRNECTGCYIAVPVDIEVSPASAVGNAPSRQHPAVPEIGQAKRSLFLRFF